MLDNIVIKHPIQDTFVTSNIHLAAPGCRPRALSLAYALKIALATLLVWPGLTLIGIDHPIWAVVTIAAVSDPDLSAAKKLVVNRITNTLAGCAVAMFTVVLFGATLISMVGALAVSVLLVTSIKNYPANWRLAPITVAILMGGATDSANQQTALHLAWLRASEIICGSLAALLMAWLFTLILIRADRWIHRSETPPPSAE